MLSLLMITLLGCGGSDVIDQPAPPPEWPMTNLVAAPRPRQADPTRRPDPTAAVPPVAPVITTPEPTPAPVDGTEAPAADGTEATP